MGKAFLVASGGALGPSRRGFGTCHWVKSVASEPADEEPLYLCDVILEMSRGLVFCVTFCFQVLQADQDMKAMVEKYEEHRDQILTSCCNMQRHL